MTERPLSSRETEPQTTPFNCVLCGVCCSVYQVRVSPEEARALADHMSMEFYEWVGRFCDPRWHDSRSYLVRHEGDHCVFLKRGEDRRTFVCSVYSVRPSSCREWRAGLDKPECREGLRRYWRVHVDDDRQLSGTPAALACLQRFVESLTRA